MFLPKNFGGTKEYNIYSRRMMLIIHFVLLLNLIVLILG